jgi:hypothetical protein
MFTFIKKTCNVEIKQQDGSFAKATDDSGNVLEFASGAKAAEWATSRGYDLDGANRTWRVKTAT